MRSGTIAFLAGTILLQQFASLPSVYWIGMLAFAFPGFFLKQDTVRQNTGRLTCWFAAGFLWALVHAHFIVSYHLEPQLEGKDVIVEGHIASLPVRRTRSWRFEFDVDTLQWEGQHYTSPGKVRLNWYRNAPPLKVGDRWRLVVRLKQPNGFMNPGGFDYEAWLFQQRIRATGYVRNKSQLGQTHEHLAAKVYHYPVQRLRQYLKSHLTEALADHSMRGIIMALAIGDRTDISASQWEILRRTGTVHLVAISGLHIGLVAGLAFFIMGRLWCWTGPWLHYVPAPKAAALAALLAALAYAALAGFSIPTQRAVIMIAVVMGAVLMQRVSQPSLTLGLALFVVLLFDPLAAMSSSLWLSFAAVAVILYGVSGHLGREKGWRHQIWRWGRVQWLISLGLLPLLLMLFQQASLVSPVANLIAVPFVSLAVVPLALLGSLFSVFLPAFGHWLLQGSAGLLNGLWPLLDWLSQLPFALWRGPSPAAWLWLFALPGLVLLLGPRGLPARWLGAVLLLPVLLVRVERPPQGEAWFTLLDVGQGLAAVVRTRHHALVFDTGPRFSDRFDTGAAVVAPFLRQQGVQKLDMLVISHGDNDHIGGVRSLLRQMPVANILSGLTEEIPWAESQPCFSGRHWVWDGVSFRILHPRSDTQEGYFQRDNNGSCVLQVTTRQGRLLLTGDIEKRAEKFLLKTSPELLKANILVAPHHGSKTSSIPEFIAAVDAEYVLFPVGYRNRYRHPNKDVVTRYQTTAATLLDTARHGAITLKLGTIRLDAVKPDQAKQGLIPVETYRQQVRRFWHRR